MPFGIGFSEVLLILVVVLLVVGPQKLPEMARTLGKGMRALRRAGDDLRDAIQVDEIRRSVYEGKDAWREATSFRSSEPPAEADPEVEAKADPEVDADAQVEMETPVLEADADAEVEVVADDAVAPLTEYEKAEAEDAELDEDPAPPVDVGRKAPAQTVARGSMTPAEDDEPSDV